MAMLKSLRNLFSRPESGEPTSPVPDKTNDPSLQLETVKSLLREGRLEEAEAALISLFSYEAPPVAHILLIQVLRMRGKGEQARNAAEAALAKFPADLAVCEEAADLFNQLGAILEEKRLRDRILYLSPEPSLDACQKWLRSELISRGKGSMIPLKEVKRITDLVVKHAHATPESALQYAETLFCIKGLEDKASSVIDLALPSGPNARRILRWCFAKDYCAEHALRFDSPAPAHSFGKYQSVPFLAELNNCIVLPSFQWQPVAELGEVLPRGYLTMRLRTKREEPTSPLLAHSTFSALLELPEPKGPHYQTAVLVGGAPNYYHQFIDFVGRLAVAVRYADLADLPLLVDEVAAPFQKDLFNLLGINEERLLRIPSTQVPRIDSLYAPSPLSSSGTAIHPMLVEWFRSKLWQPRLAKPYRRFFITRSGTTRRRIINEAELIAALAAKGFEVMRPEMLNLKEQIDLFAEAEIIVGATGAALTNMLFMQPGSSVVALYNNVLLESPGSRYFDALADAAGLRFAIVAGHGSNCGIQRLVDADFEVDITAVQHAIEASVQS